MTRLPCASVSRNWQPVIAALRTPIGSVWAPDLIKHHGRFYVYMPARTAIYAAGSGEVRIRNVRYTAL